MSVKIRVKGGKGREHVGGYLYLDTIVNRKHHWKALHIQLSSNPVARKEQWEAAECCRAYKELQLVNEQYFGALGALKKSAEGFAMDITVKGEG